jgi:hypothetical protein
MDANTKKILYYGGGALLVGAVAFFVYSFFKKDEIVIGNTAISIGDEENDNLTQTTPSKDYSAIFKEMGTRFDSSLPPTPLANLWNKK